MQFLSPSKFVYLMKICIVVTDFVMNLLDPPESVMLRVVMTLFMT